MGDVIRDVARLSRLLADPACGPAMKPRRNGRVGGGLRRCRGLGLRMAVILGHATLANKYRKYLRPYTVVTVRLACGSPAPGLGNSPG